MRIGIDAHILGKNKGGAEVYIFNILKALQKLDRKNSYVVYLTPGYNSKLIESGASNFIFKAIPFYSPWLRYSLSLPLAAAKDRIDVLHTQRVMPLWTLGRKSVLTIHDVAHQIIPETFDVFNKLFLGTLIRNSARKSRKILTVSENSKQEIIRHLEVSGEKVFVAYNGIEKSDSGFKEADYNKILKKFGIKEPYFIVIGAIEPRKNIDVIIEMAYLLNLKSDFNGTIVIVGGSRSGSKNGYIRHLFQKIEERELQKSIVFTGYLEELYKNILLRKATALICASLYEGFGIPVLEAMKFNIPAIVSNIPSFLEIAKGCVLFADPHNPESFFLRAKELLDNPGLESELKENLVAALSRFNWEDAAKVHIDVYNSFGSIVM